MPQLEPMSPAVYPYQVDSPSYYLRRNLWQGDMDLRGTVWDLQEPGLYYAPSDDEAP